MTMQHNSQILSTSSMPSAGWGEWAFALMNYGPKWRHRRRLFRQHFDHVACTGYETIQLIETRKTLARLLESPDDFHDHIKLYVRS